MTLGLDDYQSSDEEDAPAAPQAKENGASTPIQPPQQHAVQIAPPPPDAPAQGPSRGPQPQAAQPEEDQAPTSTTTSAPASPYTQSRQLTHSLTLPPLPNTAIPPSPPGSPSATSSTKVSRFLALKSQNIHFNAKLASSAQLRNPSLLQNLMDFAGINVGDGAGQYDTTLNDGDKPVPSAGFPSWAYVEELNKAQAELTVRRERKQGAKMDFVSSREGSEVGRSGTPKSVAAGAGQRRNRFDEKPAARSRSRSPKRKRER